MTKTDATDESIDPQTGVLSGRAGALARARASARLEGGDLSPAAAVLAERYVAGELDGEQLIEETVRLYR